MVDLYSLYHQNNNLLKPNSWWKLKSKTKYRYRKIKSVEILCHSTVVNSKDCDVLNVNRLDIFLELHTPITSKWEKRYALLNHLTRGFFY